MDYKGIRNRAKQFLKAGEKSRLGLLRWLVQWEPRRAVWEKNPYKITSWVKLIEKEHFATGPTYRGFKLALEQKLPVDQLGVHASVNIARLPDAKRAKILRQTMSWCGRFQQPPTYQLINEFVCERRRHEGIRPKTKTEALENKLRRERAYTVLLRTFIRRHGLKPPSRKSP